MLGGAERYGLLENMHYRINLEHTTYDDFWRERSIWRHFRNQPPAVLTVGGWFDAEDLMGPLRTYRTIRAGSPAVASHLVMGPWTHGSWAEGEGSRAGNLDLGQPTAAWYREHVEVPFFLAHLAEAKGAGTQSAGPRPGGEAPKETVAKATVFETGTNRWRRFDVWPPAVATCGLMADACSGTTERDAANDRPGGPPAGRQP